MIDLFNKSKMKSNRKFNIKNGFTLVEVVITLSIVAIVASIGIPSLIGYIDSSREKIAVAECRSVVTAAQYLANDEYDEHGTTGDLLVSYITEADILKLAEEENSSDSSLAKMLLPDFSFGIKAYADDESFTYGTAYDDITVIENKAVPEDKSGKSFIESYEFEGYTLSHMIYLSKNGIWLEYKAQGSEVVQKTTVTTINNSYSVVFKNGDKIVSIKNYNSGESVTPPEVKKDGYILKGWNLEKGDTKSSLAPTEVFTVSGSEKKIIYKAVFEASSSVPTTTVPEPTTSPDPTTDPPVTKPPQELPEPIKSEGQLYNIVNGMVNFYDPDDQSTHYANDEIMSGYIYEYGGEYYYYPVYMKLGYETHDDSNYIFEIDAGGTKTTVKSGVDIKNLNEDEKEKVVNEICKAILDTSCWGAKPIKMDLSNSITVNNNFNNWNRGGVIGSNGLVAITEDKTKAFVYVSDWSSWEQLKT